MTFLSGAMYEGDWLYDKMHGMGKMKFPDGAVLEGVWCENEPQGCGVFTWPNGGRQYHEYRHGSAVVAGLQTVCFFTFCFVSHSQCFCYHAIL